MSHLYQAIVSMPTVVITPPKHPNFSIRITSAPALLAARAADNPSNTEVHMIVSEM